MIDKTNSVSISRQAELLHLSRSSLYYEPAATSEADLALMAALDELHLGVPLLRVTPPPR